MRKIIFGKKLWSVAIIGIVIIFAVAFLNYSRTISILDRPFFVSDKKQKIEAVYVSWMCNCANFVETKNFRSDPITEPHENDYFFIEAATDDVKLDSNSTYSSRFKKIILTGQFYKDKGIPNEYELGHIEDKPDHARVFLYDKIEFLDK